MASSFIPVSMASFILNLLITVLAFYSAWINFIKQQMTSFGPDALVVFFAHLITKKSTEKLRKDPNLPRRMGVAMMLVGLSTLRIVIMYFAQK